MTKLVLLLSLVISVGAFAQPLDPPYTDYVPLTIEKSFNKGRKSTNDYVSVINLQSSVKSQGSRGTCSIFSAIGLLESVLYREGYSMQDLSEEWLEYLAIGSRTSDGSNSYSNFTKIKSHGYVDESVWSYDPNNWARTFTSKAQKYCGRLTGTIKDSCLVSHRDYRLISKTDAELTDESSIFYDVEFSEIRKTALENKAEVINKLFTNASTRVWSNTEVKELLNKKIPLTMGITVYYGAWNHSLADKYGIDRDPSDFTKGIVSNVVRGSVDYKESNANRAGHSVIIVGYDDNVIIRKNVKMLDGTTKEVVSKGVYYFKNSWGTTSFGRDFKINGVSYPGYGMIAMEYAHSLGTFYKLPVNYSRR